jgi:hypothetical protein
MADIARGVAMSERKRRIAVMTGAIVSKKGITLAVKKLRSRFGITLADEVAAAAATVAIVIWRLLFGADTDRSDPADNFFRNFNALNSRGWAGMGAWNPDPGGLNWVP